MAVGATPEHFQLNSKSKINFAQLFNALLQLKSATCQFFRNNYP
jgi:hypothetical protein